MPESRIPLAKVLNIFAAVLWLGAVLYILLRPEGFGWDFRVYRSAAVEALAGNDPYGPNFEVSVGGHRAYLPFVYPPLALGLFIPFAWLPATVGMLLWLGLKGGATWMLFRIWRRSFVDFNLDWRFGLFALFAFNAALYTDLATGNFAVFEALLLFYGVEQAMLRRPGRAAAAIVAASLFKVVPLLFLGFILWQNGRKGVRAVVYGLFGFLMYVAVNLALFPKPTAEFLATASGLRDNRSNNPSLREFVVDLWLRAPYFDPALVYPAIACVLMVAGAWTLRRSGRVDSVAVLFAWLTLALVLPRFMIYSYIQLLPAAWLALRVLRRGGERLALALLVGAVLPGSYLLIARPNISAAWERALGVQPGVWGYLSLYGAFAVWMVLMRRVLTVHLRQAPSAG